MEAALQMTKDAASGQPVSRTYTTKELAEQNGIHVNTVRFYEKIGFITKPERLPNGYRVYSPDDMERLNIIRTLRCANYSLSAILRLLQQMDRRTGASVVAILNTPEAGEDIVSVCDRLIVSLQSTAADADELAENIQNIKKNYTLQ